jgi:aarF domain-containing kinase
VPVHQVFDSFDPTPIAAASVAQVHRAVLKSNKKVVAVKVQRSTIEAQAYWDLLSFRILLRFYSRVFDLPLAYFGKYISDQIHKETDFKSELRNATLARKYISEDPVKLIRDTTYVPACYDELCSKKVIVMEYIGDAVRMTDEVGIKKMGLSIREVARTVCEAFASQVSLHSSRCDKVASVGHTL